MNYKRLVLILLFLLTLYFILYKIYIPRVSAFGCFDDCFSYAAGYFLNQNKILYSEIFYNHQMLPAYISSIVQLVSHPINIFDLVLKHRQFVMLFGFLFNFILISRFGVPAFLFFIFFEFTKFYIFGDRFLGESILIYPLVYLIFASHKKLMEKRLNGFDYIFSAFSAWLVIFLRETFTPVSLVLFFFILFPIKKKDKIKLISIGLFLFFTIAALLTVNPKEYYFELFTANKALISQIDFQKIIFYPILIFTSGKWDLFRIILIGTDLLFIFSVTYLVILKRKLKYLLFLIPLILSNLRAVEPGRLFYDSFHMVPFYGIFLAITFILVYELKKINKKIWLVLVIFSAFLFSNYILSKNVFFKEKIKPHEEFIINYGKIMEVGEAVKRLSNPKDTFFADGFDEEVYWIAQRRSLYKYSMYTSIMPDFKIYSDARAEMFMENPPDFYYGSCPGEKNEQRFLPSQFRSLYLRLDSFGKPSCVFVKKDKIKNISKRQLFLAKEAGYEIPLDKEKKF